MHVIIIIILTSNQNTFSTSKQNYTHILHVFFLERHTYTFYSLFFLEEEEVLVKIFAARKIFCMEGKKKHGMVMSEFIRKIK